MSDPNGCGPKGYGWLVPEGPKGLFKEPCNQHDKRYEQVGTEKDRIRSDWTLFKDCIAAMRKEKWYTKVWGYPLALMYLIAVLATGWLFYDYKDQEHDNR